jgi:hypothetical protein
LYSILGKFFNNSLPVSCSITHKRVDAENIGFLHYSINLDTLIEQEDLSNNPVVHLNMPGIYPLYWVCSGSCNQLNEDGSAGSEGDAGAGGEDDKDDNGPGAANEEDNAGEASGADSATTPAVSGCQESRRRVWPYPCLARFDSDGLRVPDHDARWHRRVVR